MINEHNETEAGYKMAINKFSDLTHEEFQDMLGFKHGPSKMRL